MSGLTHTDLATLAQALSAAGARLEHDMAEQDMARNAWFERLEARRRAEQEAFWAADLEIGLEAS